jgi:hypothetical protein
MTTRKLYEVATRVLALWILAKSLVAAAYGISELALASGGPDPRSVAIHSGIDSLVLFMLEAAVGIALLVLAPRVARLVGGSDDPIALPGEFRGVPILSAAISLVGVYLAAMGFANLLPALISSVQPYAAWGYTADRMWAMLAQTVIGLVFVFHRRLGAWMRKPLH